MSSKPGSVKLYFKDSAAAAVGVGTKQLLRLSAKIGKTKSRLGSQDIYIFSETDIEKMKALRN